MLFKMWLWVFFVFFPFDRLLSVVIPLGGGFTDWMKASYSAGALLQLWEYAYAFEPP